MRCLSSQQTFFVIQFAEELRAKERKSNYHLVQVAIFMSRVEEEVVGNHIPTFFLKSRWKHLLFFRQEKKELVDGNKLLLSMNRKLAIYF